MKRSVRFSPQLYKAASQIHMAGRIRLNKSLCFNTNRQKRQIHPSKLLSFQVQETDVFDETRLERWQTDTVIDKDTQIEWLSISARLLSNWDVVNSSISIHHSTGLSAAGDTILFSEIGLNPKATISPLSELTYIYIYTVYIEMYWHASCTHFDSKSKHQHHTWEPNYIRDSPRLNEHILTQR